MKTNGKITSGIPEYTINSIENTLNKYFNNRVAEVRLPDLQWALNRLDAHNNTDPLEVEVVNANLDNVLTNIYTTLTKVSASFIVRNPRNDEEVLIDKVFMLKHYKDIPLYGPKVDQYQKFIREAKVLSALSKKTKLVPVIYYYGDRQDQTIYMRDISGYNFKKKFDLLDDDHKRVLRYVRRKTPSFISENTFKNLRSFDTNLTNLEEILKSLEEKRLIKIVSRSHNGFGIISDLGASKRFIVPKDGEGIILETQYFVAEKYNMIRAALRSFLEVQKAGNDQIELIKEIIPKPNLKEYLEQDIKFLNNVILADSGGEETYLKIFKNSQKEKLESILIEINKHFVFESDDPSNFLVQFTQGDAYPGNVIGRGNSPCIVDFDKANLSFFANDIIDFLSYAGLFFGVRDTKPFYNYALSMKLFEDEDYMTKEQMSVSNLYSGVIESSFNGTLALAKIKRGLTTFGRLSEIVIKAKYLKSKKVIEDYEHTRNRYREYLSKLLDEVELGQRLKEVLETKNILVVPK